MKTPPLLLAAALLFWGWQMGWLPVAFAMALVLEGSRWLAWRLSWSGLEFHRTWDLTALLVLVAAIYNYNADELSGAVLSFVQWLPVYFFPFMVVQAYGAQEKIPSSVFLWLLRRKRHMDASRAGLNVSYLYFALCLLAASAVIASDLRYYVAVCALGGWALWAERPRRAPITVSAGLFLVAVWLGHMAHHWFREVQLELEQKSIGFLTLFFREDTDYSWSHTSIGHIGELKQSDRIVLRVESPDGRPIPPRLRQTSYNQLTLGTWFALRRNFAPVKGDPQAGWELLPERTTNGCLLLSARLKSGRTLLALPFATSHLTDLPAADVEKSPLGAVRVFNAPDAIRFQAHHGASRTFDSPPGRHDLEVPAAELKAVTQVVRDLRLDSKPPSEVLSTLARFFASYFEYTITPTERRFDGSDSASTPVGRFLRHRSGHCEYFASATTLLLRKAGIPARYATGFALPVSSPEERNCVVRERDAHAWALAYIDGQWRDFDTTPARAQATEENRLAVWQSFRDWWSERWFRFAVWRWTGKKSALTTYALWLLLLAAAALGWQLLRRRKVTTRFWRRQSKAPARPWPGLDSEFYLIESKLKKAGVERASEEPLRHWLRRACTSPALQSSRDTLEELLRLHYRHRFDPRGLTAEERAGLAARTQAWLAEN